MHPRAAFKFGHYFIIIQNVASLCTVCYDGGDCASPFIAPLGPNMLGIGFLVALTVFIRGTPWRTRGSFIKVGSSFAGTER